MSLFYGPIGFVTTVENPVGSGIWVENPVERNYRGEVSRFTRRIDSNQQVNPNLNISNSISIIADPFLNENAYAIRYIKWLGSYWEISSIDVQFPRIILSLGGVYNGPTVGATGNTGEHPRFS